MTPDEIREQLAKQFRLLSECEEFWKTEALTSMNAVDNIVSLSRMVNQTAAILLAEKVEYRQS